MNASETKIDVIETVIKKLFIKEENEDETTKNLNNYTTKEKSESFEEQLKDEEDSRDPTKINLILRTKLNIIFSVLISRFLGSSLHLWLNF